MKLTDLRVGNRCNNGVVIGIQHNSILAAGHYSISGMATFHEHELKPHLITTEWLNEFNFSVNKNDPRVYNDNNLHNGYSLGYYFDTKQGLFYYFNSAIVSVKIEYVHQFQNMYFVLTGKEL